MKKIKNIKNILFAISILVVFLLSLNTKVIAANKAIVVVETANLRAKADSDSTIVEQISEDEYVDVLEQNGEWYKVKYKTIEGYLRKDLIKLPDDSENIKNVTNTENNESATQEENKKEEQPNNTEDSQDKKEDKNDETEQANDKAEVVNNSTAIEKEEIKLGSYKIKEESEIKILPLIQAKTISTLKSNENVKVLDIKNNWAYIENTSANGWINVYKIEFEKTEETVVDGEATEKEEEKVDENKEDTNKEEENKEETNKNEVRNTKKYVSTSAANIREKANTTSDVVKSITINTEVTVLSESDGWSKVEVNGVTGYIATRLLSDTQTATSRSNETIRREEDDDEDDDDSEDNTASVSTSSASSSQGEAVVEYAKKFLGCNYVYGGTSPNGFDCSGFTQYVYNNFGVSLNRTAAAQYSNGTSVSDLQIGDLVMFGKSGINHVGIYIGGGSFIHAANRDRGVTIDTLTSGYYKTNYVGARRIY
ncbi:MAG: C40 family peptidase [Clostridia bacterium]|nr:C40 family peptidase [Clostridia bacterium]